MTKITRENINELLDAGKLQIAMKNGRWWTIRRNGATRRWIKSPERIRIPIKFGFKFFDAITEDDFGDIGWLDRQYYRIKEEEVTGDVVSLERK